MSSLNLNRKSLVTPITPVSLLHHGYNGYHAWLLWRNLSPDSQKEISGGNITGYSELLSTAEMCHAYSDTVEFWGPSQVSAHVVLPFPGAGVREDVFLIWREMEEACRILAQVRSLVDKAPQSDVSPADCSM